jgi:hypothetical protein
VEGYKCRECGGANVGEYVLPVEPQFLWDGEVIFLGQRSPLTGTKDAEEGYYCFDCDRAVEVDPVEVAAEPPWVAEYREE